jgi:hypothetical protein
VQNAQLSFQIRQPYLELSRSNLIEKGFIENQKTNHGFVTIWAMPKQEILWLCLRSRSTAL